MTTEKYLESVITNTSCKAWKLLTKCCEAMANKGFEPAVIDCLCDKNLPEKVGDRYLSIGVVGRHNGTDENVSVDISVYEVNGRHSAKSVAKVRVPKDASDKVIANRIDKAVASLQ